MSRLADLIGRGVAVIAIAAGFAIAYVGTPALTRLGVWGDAAVALVAGALGCAALRHVRGRGAQLAALHAERSQLVQALAQRTGELEAVRAELAQRAREADAFLEIAQASRSILDEPELLRHIARGAAAACDAARCSIYLVDDAAEWATPAASQSADGTPDPAAWQALKALGKLKLAAVPFIQEAVRRRTPVVIADPATDPRAPRSWLEAADLTSLLAVPLLYRRRVIGVSTFAYTRAPRPIRPDQVQLAVSLAEQIALAIQTARLHTDTDSRRREAEVVADLAAAINASLDLDTVLQRVTEAAMELCKSEVAAIALRDRHSSEMRLRYHLPAEHPAGRAAPRPRDAADPVLLLPGSPAPTENRTSAPRMRDEYASVMLTEGVVAVLVVPIRSEQGVEGLLYVGNHSPRPFAAHHKAILTRLADHAAIAIRNSQLYEAAQTRLSRMTRLTQLGQLISSSLNYREVLEFVTHAAVDLLGGDMARLWVVDEQARVVRLVACIERNAQTSGDAPPAEFPLGQGLVGWVVQHKTKRYSPNLLLDPLQISKTWVAAGGYTSQIAVPLTVGERALGALAVLTKAPRQFRPEEEELLELFAAQAATALENARLYQAAQQAYEQLAQTQHQLVQAQKMEAIGRLAGGVAHDFNNLLTIIKGRCDLLLAGRASDDRVTRHLGLISKTAERAAALTRQLLAFSRKQLAQPKVLNLNTAVTDMDRMLRHLIGEDIELTTALQPGLWNVRADSAQLGQVLMNLVVNARDAMPDGGRLRIATANVELDAVTARHHLGAHPGRYVYLTVRDTGVGMGEETRAHLFEPFFTTKEPGKGTGLGLATVYGIVEQNGGLITVDSASGQGATFGIYLPAVDEAVTQVEAASSGDGVRSGAETILLVEDEPEVRGLAREILSAHGYTVLEAEDGTDGLRVAKQHAGPIHLLLTDVVMPRASGRALADALLPLRPETKVLYMSGHTDDVISHHGVLKPGIALLPKPFTPEALLGKIRDTLDAAPAPAPALTA